MDRRPMHSDVLTLEEAHRRAFARGPRTDEYERWLLRIWLEGIPVWIPNPPAHGHALRAHDLHHVLTGYGLDWVGEAELGAWELAGGCGAHVAAFPFDLAALGMGLVIAPRRTWSAFVRGRRTKNLFANRLDRAVLARPIGEVRGELLLDRDAAEASAADRALFALWSAASLAFYASMPISLGLAALALLAPPPRS